MCPQKKELNKRGCPGLKFWAEGGEKVQSLRIKVGRGDAMWEEGRKFFEKEKKGGESHPRREARAPYFRKEKNDKKRESKKKKGRNNLRERRKRARVFFTH